MRCQRREDRRIEGQFVCFGLPRHRQCAAFDALTLLDLLRGLVCNFVRYTSYWVTEMRASAIEGVDLATGQWCSVRAALIWFGRREVSVGVGGEVVDDMAGRLFGQPASGRARPLSPPVFSNAH